MYYNYRSGGGIPTYTAVTVTSSSIGNSNQQYSTVTNPAVPAYLGAASVLICFTSAFLSLALAFFVIPRQVTPWTANEAGRASNQLDSSDYDSSKGHQRNLSNWDVITCFYGSGMAFLAIITPSLPCFFGISALFARSLMAISEEFCQRDAAGVQRSLHGYKASSSLHSPRLCFPGKTLARGRKKLRVFLPLIHLTLDSESSSASFLVEISFSSWLILFEAFVIYVDERGVGYNYQDWDFCCMPLKIRQTHLQAWE
ncbi:hypothetical protein HPP92_001761 [Vanilla planifolia]|uniref:Uncharacterized protein n=1 Tax=Vanilla planifolia TaxID=51239 RepID=A0A835RYL8_VANPL|nr:hypothetical protein HPP92_001761 [Vanilla planifolia]